MGSTTLRSTERLAQLRDQLRLGPARQPNIECMKRNALFFDCLIPYSAWAPDSGYSTVMSCWSAMVVPVKRQELTGNSCTVQCKDRPQFRDISSFANWKENGGQYCNISRVAFCKKGNSENHLCLSNYLFPSVKHRSGVSVYFIRISGRSHRTLTHAEYYWRSRNIRRWPNLITLAWEPRFFFCPQIWHTIYTRFDLEARHLMSYARAESRG